MDKFRILPYGSSKNNLEQSIQYNVIGVRRRTRFEKRNMKGQMKCI